MTIELVFYTQIASILGFISALFILYRLLVEQKDSTIQNLKERIQFLSMQLEEAQQATPDILAKRLSNRVDLLEEELERLHLDNNSTKDQKKQKAMELDQARQNAEILNKQISLAQQLLSNFLCPLCGAPLDQREYCLEPAEYNGRDEDIEHEFSRYECGYTVVDGKPDGPCRNHNNRKRN